MHPRAFLNRIGTATPPYEAHAAYGEWAARQLADVREATLLRRMMARSAIESRWSVLPPARSGQDQTGEGGFYQGADLPATSARMAIYAKAAPELCLQAVEALGGIGEITHVVVASCTGFVAPGIDQILARRLGLSTNVERTMIGFMGCYAAIAALRTAYDIVRSRGNARVLVVTVELCTLHLQATTELESILAMMLFGDGAAAALVSAEPEGLALSDPFSVSLPDSDGLINWTIGDTGFSMHLSGEVPGRIADALAAPSFRARIGDLDAIDGWAVHAGGRSVLDAVQQGLQMPPHALDHSREVLRKYGNMSSATLMFVLERFLAGNCPVSQGVAMAFGPGLAAEGMRFSSVCAEGREVCGAISKGELLPA